MPVGQFKRTKIVATVGPSTDSPELIAEMIKAGANGLRLNFSHGTDEQRVKHIRWIRQASKDQSKPVAIIADLQGPKLRLGDFEGVISIKAGQELRFQYKSDYSATKHIPLQYDLSTKVRRGERLQLNDGRLRTTVTAVRDKTIFAKAENDGVLQQRKSISLPDTNLDGDIITKKDHRDIVFCANQDIDYVALSFVQTASDIRSLKRLLKNQGSGAAVIAKIETKAAVENLEEIVADSDSVMIARGDLGVETILESVPIVQRRIIGLGLKNATPTIVATQMLASMTERDEPTRAEVSDVATAVMVGADAVMLSDETASGKFPIEAIKMMKRIVTYAEENTPLKAVFHETEAPPLAPQKAIAGAVIKLADDVRAQAIVAETKSGATARQLAALRPVLPIVAVTSQERVANQLTLVYGIKSFVRPDENMAAKKLTDWLQANKVLKKGDIIISCSGQHPGVVGTTDTIKVRFLD